MRLDADVELEEFVIVNEATTPTKSKKGDGYANMLADEGIELEDIVQGHEATTPIKSKTGEASIPLKGHRGGAIIPQKNMQEEGSINSINSNKLTEVQSLSWSIEVQSGSSAVKGYLANFCIFANSKQARASSGSRADGDEIKYSITSGLPRGWTADYDRFIAYLDTHAPLNSNYCTQRKEWEIGRYDIDEMVDLLKAYFVYLRDKVS